MPNDNLNLQIPVKINLSDRYRTIPNKRNRTLSLAELIERGEKSLIAWIETGNLSKAAKQLIDLFGKELNPAIIRNYAVDYILEHPEESRKIYQKYGEFPDTEEGNTGWLWHIINIAVRQIKSKPKFIRWAIRKGFYKKAFYLFKEAFNLSDEDYNAFDDVIVHD